MTHTQLDKDGRMRSKNDRRSLSTANNVGRGTARRVVMLSFPRLKLKQGDIVAFGFILICMASACGGAPAWISKFGEMVLVTFPLIVIIWDAYFYQHEEQP
jgi:hypothetical protein